MPATRRRPTPHRRRRPTFPASIDAAFGQAVWLMMNTPAYRHVFLTDLEWMVLPPIMLGQFRVFFAGGRAVAFAAWAALSAEAETRLQEPNPRLAPVDWKSGDRLWLVNLFAPFGHGEAALKELRETALEGKSFKMHRMGADGKRVVEMIDHSLGPLK
jgi:cytolysin-activating lysine-acyltransferase